MNMKEEIKQGLYATRRGDKYLIPDEGTDEFNEYIEFEAEVELRELADAGYEDAIRELSERVY